MAAKYKIVSIGAAFSDKAIREFENRLTSEAGSGWELHTVFSVQKTGCFGSSDGNTYLAVFRNDQG
ncbi:DUF4177 domain-containing protein [Oceaniovalibus sp. ACAM 378]|nr:DUF4177 domain-containing protein [Oceaniovalibus sp. ACAM 378]